MEIIDAIEDTPAIRASREFVEVGSNMVRVPDSVLANEPCAGTGMAILGEILKDIDAGQVKTFAGITDFARASLIHFRGVSGHKPNSKLVRLVQIPLYYEEVKPFTPIDPDHMRQREVFARATGYVLIGPDECIAVLQQSADHSHISCGCFENNDLGVPRSLAGYYAQGIEFHAQAKRIAELDVTRTSEAISRVSGDHMWWAPQTHIVSELQIERMVQTIQMLEAHLRTAPDERSASGAVIRRSFIGNGDVGSTAELRPRSEGWVSYPTGQDAWYYGVWVNPIKLETLTYAEQDVIHVVCQSEEQFRSELAGLARFHSRHLEPNMMAIGADETVVSFDVLSFLKGKTQEVCFDAGAEAKDAAGNWVPPVAGTLKLDHPVVEQLEDGQSVILGRDVFEMNVLDARAFDAKYVVSLSRSGDVKTLTVEFEGDDRVLCLSV